MSLDDKLIEAGFSDLTKSLKYGLPEEEGGLEFSQFELFAKSLEESLYQLCDTDDPECVNLGNANNFAYSALKRWTKESLELTGNILAKYFPECSLFTSVFSSSNTFLIFSSYSFFWSSFKYQYA